jgi:hypothetical protein
MAVLKDLWLPVVAALASVAAADDTNILITETARAQNQSLLWGAYRPNLYFGVRPRIAKSLMGGLMWSKVDNFQDVQHSKLTVAFPIVGGYWDFGDGDTFKDANWVHRFQTYLRAGG